MKKIGSSFALVGLAGASMLFGCNLSLRDDALGNAQPNATAAPPATSAASATTTPAWSTTTLFPH
jgi:hypothetical protein